jgi:antitoxin VapB
MVKIAKLFKNGNSQAVRIPQEFRFEGDRVRMRKEGNLLILEPVAVDVKEWLADLRRHPLSKDFMAEGRNQPADEERKLFE